MNLSKAIEILGDMIIYQYSASKSDEGDAVKLGIEALNRYRDKDHLTFITMMQPLPGETEE